MIHIYVGIMCNIQLIENAYSGLQNYNQRLFCFVTKTNTFFFGQIVLHLNVAFVVYSIVLVINRGPQSITSPALAPPLEHSL